jgi:broad specificity phosphatase PhoE
MRKTAWSRAAAAVAILAAGTLGTATDAAAVAQNERTVVILVRHAEKEAEPATDPGLTPQGQARAADLARRLSDAGVDAVFTSQFERTKLTGEPLARQIGQQVRIAPIAGPVEAYATALEQRILHEYAGQTVVVVNHSNTVPMIARALGAPDPGEIDDAEYGTMLIVVIGPGSARDLIRANY